MKLTNKDILVCMALREEGGEALEKIGANILYTGLGKVNAAYRITKSLQENKPKLVLNLGTAGSKLFKPGEMVSCNRFIQRDMDVSPIGFKKFQTPFEVTPMVIETVFVVEHLPRATCGTGDSFEIDHSHDRGEVVDMEAYALAKICHLEKVDFACVKYISDGADEAASQDWQESLASAAIKFVEAYQTFVK